MDTYSFEKEIIRENEGDNETRKLSEYKKTIDNMRDKIFIIKEDWEKILKEDNWLPHTKKGIEVLNYLVEVSNGPFIRNLFRDLINFVEKEQKEENFQNIAELVGFSSDLKMAQSIVWGISEEDQYLKSLAKFEDANSEPVATINNVDIFYTKMFYVSIKNLSQYLERMSDVLNNNFK